MTQNISDSHISKPPASDNESPLDIGSRMELFVDDTLIAQLNNATRQLHSPTPRDTAIEVDKPWESPHIYYPVIVDRAPPYRMYYRSMSNKNDGTPCYTGYAESQDGIAWEKPELGIIEYRGNKRNNLVFDESQTTNPSAGVNLWPFKDANPEARASEQYKAMIPFRTVDRYDGFPLMAVASADGLHWQKIQDEPIDQDWALKSEKTNYVFWDTNRKRYVSYIRVWTGEGHPIGLRQVMRMESEDFLHWQNMQLLDYGDAPQEHLYTFAAQQYFRAPHIYVSLAKRYVPSAENKNDGGQAVAATPRRLWPPCASHDTWQGFSPPGNGVSDCVFSASRDGLHWQRFFAAFIRPGRDPENWTDRNMCPVRGLVQTARDELSVYWVEHYLHPTARIRRGTIRLDGFVSLHATYPPGECLTRPLIVAGEELVINYASSAAGGIRVEVQDIQGRPIPGYTLAESADIYGDEIERVVTWQDRPNASRLAPQPVRLRFVMQDADLYSFRFRSSGEREH